MDIDKIEITNNDISMIIFPKDNHVLINNNFYDIKDEEIESLIRIIRNWDNFYYDPNGLDGIMFNIKIYCDNEVDEIKGIRKAPINYRDFCDLIRTIYDRG